MKKAKPKTGFLAWWLPDQIVLASTLVHAFVQAALGKPVCFVLLFVAVVYHHFVGLANDTLNALDDE